MARIGVSVDVEGAEIVIAYRTRVGVGVTIRTSRRGLGALAALHGAAASADDEWAAAAEVRGELTLTPANPEARKET